MGTGALQPEYVFHVFQMTLKRARIRIPQHPPGDALTLLQTHTTEHRSRHAAVRRRTPTANGTATRRTDTKPASDTNREHQDTPVYSFAAHSTGMRCAVYAHALLPESYQSPAHHHRLHDLGFRRVRAGGKLLGSVRMSFPGKVAVMYQ